MAPISTSQRQQIQRLIVTKYDVYNVTRVIKRLGQIRRLYPEPYHTKQRYRHSTKLKRSTSRSTTDQITASNADYNTTPKSIDLVEPPTKNVEQLPTPSRTVSPDLPESISSVPICLRTPL